MSKKHPFSAPSFLLPARIPALSVLALSLVTSGCASFGVPGTHSWEGSFLRDGLSGPEGSSDGNAQSDAISNRWSSPSRSDDFEENANSARSVRPGDISLGMSLQEVRESWGAPRDVEFAGESHRGNQRWIFPLGVDPRISPARVIYFERGRVVGWETVHP